MLIFNLIGPVWIRERRYTRSYMYIPNAKDRVCDCGFLSDLQHPGTCTSAGDRACPNPVANETFLSRELEAPR